jgi:hypothetical protein
MTIFFNEPSFFIFFNFLNEVTKGIESFIPKDVSNVGCAVYMEAYTEWNMLAGLTSSLGFL